MLPVDFLGQEHKRGARRIDDRSLGRRDQALVIVQHLIRSARNDNRASADVACDPAGFAGFIQGGVGNLNRERWDRRAANMTGQCHHDARINAAAQVGHHRHVGTQAAFDRALQDVLELIDDALGIATRIFIAAVGKVDFPVGAFLDPRRLSLAAELNAQIVAGRKGLDSGKASDRPRQRKECKELVDAARIGPHVDQSGGKEGLDFGSEQQPFAVMRALARPVERADAEAVARQVQPLAALIIKGNGKLAVKLEEGCFLVILPKVRNDLRIAMGREAMSPALELGALLDIIEQLAIVNHVDAAVFVADRLPAVGQADDAQPARSHPQAGQLQEPVLIRSTVDHGVGHCLQHPCRHRPLTVQIHDSCDSAHPRVLRSHHPPNYGDRRLSRFLLRTTV